MKIAFINSTTCGVVYAGIVYVMTAIEENGHEVCLIDLNFAPRENYVRFALQEIRKIKPDVIGFSTLTPTHFRSLEIAEKVKKEFPSIIMVWGGTHSTILPEQAISHSLVDAICIGDGEITFPEFLDKLKQDKEPLVDGIWYKSNGKIKKNKLRPFIHDLDKLSFPRWEYYDLEKYFRGHKINGSIDVVASRGCSFRCSYCTAPLMSELGMGNHQRFRSPDNIIAEIKRNIIKYSNKGLNSITFHDETFGYAREQFDILLSKYAEEGLHHKLFWVCQTRAELITEEWAQKASHAGCIAVEMGVESGNEDIRKNSLNKHIANKDFIKTAKILSKYNILYQTSFIIGTPEDTKATIFESIKFAKNIEPIGIRFTLYYPLPRTRLEEQIRLEGLLRTDKLRQGMPTVDTKHLKAETLDKIYFIIRLWLAVKYLKIALRHLGLKLFVQIFKYAFNLNKNRALPLMHPFNRGGLIENMVMNEWINKRKRLIYKK